VRYGEWQRGAKQCMIPVCMYKKYTFNTPEGGMQSYFVTSITIPVRAAAPPLPGNRPIKQEGRRGALLRCVEINDNNK